MHADSSMNQQHMSRWFRVLEEPQPVKQREEQQQKQHDECSGPAKGWSLQVSRDARLVSIRGPRA